MAPVASIHIWTKSRNTPAAGALKKSVAKSHELAISELADSSLVGDAQINSGPANGVLSIRLLAKQFLTKQTLTKQFLTGQALSRQALTTQALTTQALTEQTLTEHVRARLLVHAHIALPGGVLARVRMAQQGSECQGIFTGIGALDHKIGSIPTRALTQVCAPPKMSSGISAILFSLLTQATDKEEMCALIDAGDGFAPSLSAAADVDLSRLLWVRCGNKIKADLAEKPTNAATTVSRSTTASTTKTGLRSTNGSAETMGLSSPNCSAATTNLHSTNGSTAIAGLYTTSRQSMIDGHAANGHCLIASSGETTGRQSITNSQKPIANARQMQPLEQAFKAADILIQNGGFGLIAIDLSEIEERLVRKIPLTTWFRFARVIERQPTALVVFATYPAAQSCAALTLHIKGASACWHTGAQAHAQFLSGLACEVEPGIRRGRARNAQSADEGFAANPAWNEG